jgi:hypothetical protein
MSRGSSVSIVTRLWAGRPGFNSRQGQGYFLIATTARPALEPTQTRIQWVLGGGGLPSLLKRPGREAATHIQLVPRLRIRGAMPHSPVRLHDVVFEMVFFFYLHKLFNDGSFLKNNYGIRFELTVK